MRSRGLSPVPPVVRIRSSRSRSHQDSNWAVMASNSSGTKAVAATWKSAAGGGPAPAPRRRGALRACPFADRQNPHPEHLSNHLDGVAHLHCAFLQHPGEDSFPGHDAISHLLPDGAAFMADLADLGDLQQHLSTHLEAGPHRQGHHFQALHRQVFGKIPRGHRGASGHHLLDAGQRQQAHLAAAAFGVGVAFQAVLRQQTGRRHVVFNYPFAVAD